MLILVGLILAISKTIRLLSKVILLYRVCVFRSVSFSKKLRDANTPIRGQRLVDAKAKGHQLIVGTRNQKKIKFESKNLRL